MPNTSLRRLTTKTLPKIHVNDWRRKFYKSGTAEENSSPRSVWQTPREIPLKVRWKFNEGNSATKVRAALLLDGNPATGPTNTVQRRKHLLQFATNSVLLQLYPIHIFTSQIYKYDKGWSYSGGASSQRRIILQALTRLNFFDFQKFEYHYFNDFSIVIDNSPESNGYQFLSMTRKFWRFSNLDQPQPRLRAHRDPPHTSSRIFPLLSTFLTYCETRTIRRHFCDAINAYAAAQNSFIHSCMIQHEKIFSNIFSISRQIPLTKFFKQVILCDTGIAKISVVSLQHLRTDRKFYKQHPTFLREDKLPTYFRSLHTFAEISSTDDTQRRVESWYFFLDLQVLQWLLVQKDVETKHKK